MKIKLSLSSLESRENPSASPFDAEPAENANLTETGFFFEGTAWYEDTNPMPDVAPVNSNPPINTSEFLGGDSFGNPPQSNTVTTPAPTSPPVHNPVALPRI